MLSLPDFLLGGVLPGAAALAVRAVVGRLVSDKVSDQVAWPVAIAAGYAAGQAGLLALENSLDAMVAPREASHWLPLAGVLAAGIGLIPQCCRAANVVTLFSGGLLAIALPTRLLWGSVYLLSDWSTGEAVARIGGVAAVMLAIGWLLTKQNAAHNLESAAAENQRANNSVACDVARHKTGWSDALIAPLLAMVVVGLAVVIATSGSLSYARLAGVILAAMVGATLGGVGQLKFSQIGAGVPAAGPVVVTLVGGLLLVSVLYAEVTIASATLLTIALAAAGAKRGWAPKCPWRQSVLRTMCCLVPLAIATVWAATEFAEATSQPGEENPYLNWSPPNE